MTIFSSKSLTKVNFLNIILAIIPLSFIAGNLVINLNIAFFILFSFLIYGKDIFNIKYQFLDKLVLFFFLFVLVTGIYNNIDVFYNKPRPYDFEIILKSLTYLRFLLLYLILRFLIEQNLMNFKLFFLSSSIFSLLVGLDIFYQSIFGKDVFGHLPIGLKLGGPFGDELIAGSYLQRFSLFSFFIIPLFFTKYKKIIYFILPLMFIYFFTAIVFSGNRMPLVLYLLSIFLIFVFEKTTKKYFIVFAFTFLLIFISIYNMNTNIKTNFDNFYTQVKQLSKVVTGEKIDKFKMPSHYKEFDSFYNTWLINKYIGGGIKQFRYNCHERQNIDRSSKFICNTHPHNYYLEILTELGLLGFFILSLLFLITFYKSFIKKYIIGTNLKFNNIITPFIFLFIVEIFPIKSSGSFFTTGNATFIFLILSFTIALSCKKN